ncbi:hypothetical protein Asp14428_21180 [Actinoplanes sp. NBRC 14428]|nr:hypothetical protein Asp14428_21180 [Actinoplanes sp. NBRC 14428]
MNLRRSLSVLVALVAVLTMAPSPAHAAPAVGGTLKFGWRGVEFFAASGIANDLRGFTAEDGTLSVYDTGRDIAIDPDIAYKCTKTQGQDIIVVCKFNAYLFFQLGDRDDRIQIGGPIPVSVQGGSGNDQLDANGQKAPASLYGQQGDDRLWGGPAGDYLDVGAGDRTKQSIVDYWTGDDTCKGAFDYSVGCDRF